MSKQELLKKWSEISDLISKEMDRNEKFRLEMEHILMGEKVTPAPKKQSRRSPAKVDPFSLLASGETVLSEALKKLTLEELKDVVSQYGLDRSGKALKWKDRERLEAFIIDSATRSTSRGKAFWNS